MPSCAVSGCSSGYATNPERVHFFILPKNKIIAEQWLNAINAIYVINGDLTKKKTFKSSVYVCEHHFLESQILWERQLLDSTGRVLGVSKYKVPRLKPGTVPSKFPWDDFCTNSNPLKLTAPIAADRVEPLFEMSCENRENETTSSLAASSEIHVSTGSTIDNFEQPEQDRKEDSRNCEMEVNVDTTSSSLQFANIITALSLPSGWMAQISEASKMLTVVSLRTTNNDGAFKVIVAKAVMLSVDMSVQVRVYNEMVNLADFNLPNQIDSIRTLEDLILAINRLHICAGLTVEEEIGDIHCAAIKKGHDGHFRHTNCSGLLVNTGICRCCRIARKSLTDKLRRIKQKKLTNKSLKITSTRNPTDYSILHGKYVRIVREKRKVLQTNKSLKSLLRQSRSDMARISQNDFQKLIVDGKIEKNQQETVKAIINSAKRSNSKGQRYTEEWILLCLLMHMRSPAGYVFLRSNNILPLPAVKTVRRYLSKIEANCGFDDQFFKVLKIAMDKKSEFSRHGILLLDEISTRESVTVDAKNLTYKALINFGRDGQQSTDFSEKANHCLVFMYQSLNDSQAQPIAVFASRGPVKGDVLAMLVVKAIAIIERIGVKIHGVVSDGASSNRKFWSLLGIIPTKKDLRNFFEDPVDQGRRVYVFSDPPHLIKTIRNRLFQQRVLQMDSKGPQIKWEHLEKLHEVDLATAGPGQALVCPKLTKNHIYLSGPQKMRVRLATQVFSNAVAGGLKFYRGTVEELKDCEATADFCKWINDLFDALNRIHSIHGVVPGNADYKQIEESLLKLDAWEEEIQINNLSKNLFLTKQTAEGLRVTLKSMLDLVSYLTEECKFPHVLTGRINQDPLEKFFGTARQAGGCNDHPSTPTFLQIYKILCTYSMLKPPKKGNCSVSSDSSSNSLITLAELKEIYNNPEHASAASRTVKEKLNVLIRQEDWNLEIIGDHSYSRPEVRDCVLYCLTADILKRIHNTVKCLACKEALVRPDTRGILIPESILAEWQQKPGLVHPNSNLYRFILVLESLFQKYCNSTFVFENMLHEINAYKNLAFPCLEHAHDVIFQLIQYFVRMRMQQYCTRINAEAEKMNLIKKKLSKFCTT